MNNSLLAFFMKFSKIVHPKLLTKFGGLKNSLAKASLKTGYQVYLGFVIFTAVVTGVVSFVVSIPFLDFFGVVNLFRFGNLFGLPDIYVWAFLVGVLSGLSSFGICYFYPRYVSYSRGNKIDANLPTIANFLSVLASAGMPPESIIRSLARVGKEFRVEKEANAIVGDIELMGFDLQNALKRASERSPSKQLGRMLDGIGTTSVMGGDLAGYLRDESDKYRRAKSIIMRHFLDNLGIIAETYITFMVAAPLMLVVMLSVMTFIGGGISLGSLGTDMLLNLVTFVMLPAGVIILIMAVDTMSPQR